MRFHVGQRVICVNDTFDNPYAEILRNLGAVSDLQGLRGGRVYTIRDVLPDYDWRHGNLRLDCVRVVEIVRRDDEWGRESAYWAGRFEPLRERKTDISVFQRMLRDVSSVESGGGG